MVCLLLNEFCLMWNKDFWWLVYGVLVFGYCYLVGFVCYIYFLGVGVIYVLEKIDLCFSFNGFDLLNIIVLLGFWYIFNY